MSKSKQTTRKPNAAERIKALEEALVELNGKMLGLAEVIDQNGGAVDEYVARLDQKFIALAKRVNASLEVSNTSTEVDKMIQADDAKKLEAMVNTLKEQGILKDIGKEGVIKETTFVVGRHVSSEGNELTPRLQFYTGSLANEEKEKFIGKKIGDMISGEDETVAIEITEIYETVDVDKEVEFTDEKTEKEYLEGLKESDSE